MAQMPALLPKEVEIQRLKKIWLIVIAMGSTAASVEVDNFVDGSLHQTSIRDSAFTPAHWWLYSHLSKDDNPRISCNHVYDWS